MNKIERAALLRARYAGRYDLRQSLKDRRGTKEEYTEEQAAMRVEVPKTVFLDLIRRKLITKVPCRLTATGRAALMKGMPS